MLLALTVVQTAWGQRPQTADVYHRYAYGP